MRGREADVKVMIVYNLQLIAEVRTAVAEAQKNYREVDDAARQSFNGQ